MGATSGVHIKVFTDYSTTNNVVTSDDPGTERSSVSHSPSSLHNGGAQQRRWMDNESEAEYMSRNNEQRHEHGNIIKRTKVLGRSGLDGVGRMTTKLFSQLIPFISGNLCHEMFPISSSKATTSKVSVQTPGVKCATYNYYWN